MKDNPFNLTPEQLEIARRPVLRSKPVTVEEYCKETERLKNDSMAGRGKTSQSADNG